MNPFLLRLVIVTISLCFLIPKNYSQEEPLQNRSKLSSSSFHHHKAHLIDSYTKFSTTRTGKIAFLGGSITYNGGWRDSIMQYFIERFPNTEFTFINAGIPSMGSTPGAFRLERDVLSEGPIDLLFEEAAVNDQTNGRSAHEQIRALEGIFRHLWEENPQTDIILMHFVDPGKMEKYRKGIEPEVMRNHQLVADYYRVSEINLAKEVTSRIDHGEFSWEEDFIDLHPSPFGQSIYASSIIHFLEDAFEKIEMDSILIKKKWKVNPIDRYSYTNGKLIDISSASFHGAWRIDEKWEPNDAKGVRNNYHNVPMLIGENTRGSAEMNFTGSLIGIAVAAGPDAAVIEYRLDKGEWEEIDLLTKWSSVLHLPWYYTLCADLRFQEHVLEIRLKDASNPRSERQACRIRYFYTN